MRLSNNQRSPKKALAMSSSNTLEISSSALKTIPATCPLRSSDRPDAPLGEKKRVTFASICTVRPTISHKDFSNEEKASTWYSSQEFKMIQSKSFKLVLRQESGQGLQGRRYCSRGLEGFTQQGLETKRMNRALAGMTVLGEQENQLCEKGCVDYDAIACAYEQVTSSSRMWAQFVGAKDRKIAIACYGKFILPFQRKPAPSTTASEEKMTLTANSRIKQIESNARATRRQENAKAA